MAVVAMEKISVCALKTNRKAILETLQSLGVMQVVTDELDDPELLKMDTAEAKARFDKNADLADQAVAILDKYAPEQKGLLDSFAGKEVVESSQFERIIENQTSLMKTATKIQRREKDISECKGTILRDENQIESLVPWMSLDVPMSFDGTKKTDAFIGSVSGVLDEAMLYAVLKEKAPDVESLSANVISSGNDSTNIFVMCMKEDRETVEAALRAIGYARPAQAVLGVPSKVMEECKADIRREEEEIKKLEEKIRAKAGMRGDLKIVADYYRTRAEKYRILGTIPQSKSVFFLEGWVPAEAAPRVKSLLTEKYGAIVETETKGEEEEEPTLLKNNKFSANYEPILASYGLPKHGKVDPTVIMSAFYMFFFGMMLSDAGYGLLMVIGTAIVLKKYPNMAENMKKMITMFFWCGVSTTFWGFMFGGFFGDVIDVFAKTVLGYTGQVGS